jgi:hypothetical protein
MRLKNKAIAKFNFGHLKKDKIVTENVKWFPKRVKWL